MTRSSLIKKLCLGLTLGILACVSAVPEPVQAEPLYFALEVRHEGRLVAQPKLLGETGRTVRAERRQPGARVPDYQLVLTPTAEGSTFHLDLDLKLPETSGRNADVALSHGQAVYCGPIR